ncbi:hypothetical protein BH18ACT15_BH18ACT15_15440 [soil metagenome]
MAALSYLLLPISGLVAYLKGRKARTRFHGLQAILVGLLWPVALLACSAVSPGATQVAFGAGALLWLTLLVSSAAGADLRLPVVGPALWRVALASPDGTDAPPSESV